MLLVLSLFWCNLVIASPTLAIADLQNHTGETRFDGAGPGAANVLVAKLAGASSLTLVERSRLQAILAELELSQTGLVDRATAVEAGKLVGADYLLFGSIVGLQGSLMALNVRVVSTQSAEVVLSDEVMGNIAESPDVFFDMLDAVAELLIDGLRLEVSPQERHLIRTVRGRELEALQIYGGGEARADEAEGTQRLRAAALLDFLGTDEPQLAACDPDRADGERVAAGDGAVPRVLLRALQRGELSVQTYLACLARFDADATAEVRTQRFSQVLKVATRLLGKGSSVPVIEAVAQRPVSISLEKKRVAKARKALRKAEASQSSALLADSLAADEGRWRGEQVTPQRLAALDESALVMLRLRLPDAELRHEATVALVRARIARSPFAAVRDDPEGVLRQVLDDGRVAVSEGARLTGGGLASEHPGIRSVQVVASPRASSATLLVVNDEGEATREPVVSLAALALDFVGYEQGVPLCVHVPPLEPTPCVPQEQLAVDHPWVTLTDGALRVRQRLTLDEVVALGRSGDALAVDLEVRGTALPIELPVVFAPVRSLVHVGSTGAAGPELALDVYAISHDRLLIGLRRPGSEQHGWAAVVEQSDPAFSVMSVGGAGSRGTPGVAGQDGADGIPGAPGSCDRNGGKGGDGADGSDGGPGGDGGMGGDGGRITVALHCDERCDALEAWVLARFRSVGGAGGYGGPGGSGGAGGKAGLGGQGAQCEERDDDGRVRTRRTFDGHRGSTGGQGARGPNGRQGPAGRAGEVQVTVVR